MDRTTNDALKFQIDKVEVILFFCFLSRSGELFTFFMILLREMTYRFVGFFQVNVTQES